MEAAKKTDNTICDAFAEFAVQTGYEKIPSEVIHQAKRCVLDLFGVALAGSSVGIAPCMSSLFRDMGGTPEAKDLYSLFDDTINRLLKARKQP